MPAAMYRRISPMRRRAVSSRQGFIASSRTYSALLCLLAAGCAAPRKTTTDLQSAQPLLRDIVETRSFAAGDPTHIAITPDEHDIFFLRSGPRDRVQNLHAFEVLTGQTRLVASAETLLGGAAEVLSPEEKSRRERQRIRAKG